MSKIVEKITSWVLIGAMVIQPTLLYAQSIQVVGPDNGPRPHLDQSYNGTPVINIGTPNAAGVSHDIYTEFTADDLILNNSATNVDTQLGGWIEGNPNLARGQAADLWIGEVVGGSQTQLSGILEVAGQSMDVVLANEFGITCNGCGFINTGRATLTTGTPRFGSTGALSGFDVKQGVVTIGADGLNPESRLSLADTSRIDVIARAAAIYGAMRADQLNVVTGANIVDYNWSYDAQTGAVTGITEQSGIGAAPALAVDVAALGGMYANAIQLVATENGVGVRLNGEMASSSNIALRADGQLTLGAPAGGHTPQIKAREKIIIRNQGPLLLEGSITSENGNLIDIRTSIGTLIFTGQADAGAMTLESAGLANISAAITVQNAFKVRSLTESVTLGSGLELSAASIDVDAVTSATLMGKATATGDVTVNAGTDLSTGIGSKLSGNTIALNGQSVATAGDAMATQGLVVAAGSGGANNSGSLSGTDVTIISAASLQNSGKISAHNLAKLTAVATLTTGVASETFGTDVTLSGADATLDGVIKADDVLNITTSSGDLVVRGTLAAATTTLISAADLINAGAIAGTVSVALNATDILTTASNSEVFGSDVDLAAAAIVINGNVVGTTTLDLAAGSGGIENGGVLIGAATTLVSGGEITNRGTISGQDSVRLTAVTMLKTQVGSAVYGDVLTLRGAGVITDGVVKADQTLVIMAGLDGLANSGTLSAQTVLLKSQSSIENSGIVSAGSALTLEAATTVTNAASLISGDDLAIYADQIINNGGVIWANDSITLAANVALDRASLLQNSAGRIEAFQGDLIIRADEVANLGIAPTIGASEIIKWLEQGSSGPIEAVDEFSKLIDAAYLDADGHILSAYAAEYSALWADVINGGGTLSALSQSILKPAVTSPSGTAIKDDFAGLWEDMFAKANVDGTPDPAARVIAMVDPAIFDVDGTVLPAHAQAYAALWVTLASGGTSVTPSVKGILVPAVLVVESTTTDPATGVVTTIYSNDLVSDNTDVWAAMTAASGASYDIIKILYQDRFNDDGQLAELVAGGTVDIEADDVRNIFGNISAGDDLLITASTVTNQAIGASQVLLEVHKKPGCFTCHEGEVDFYDTFGGRIEAVGSVQIIGSLSNVTLNSSELSLQDVMDEMNAYIAAQQAAGDADLAGVPAVRTKNLEFHDKRQDDFTAPVEGNGTDIREISAVDTAAQTTVDTGGGTPLVIPLDPGSYSTTVEALAAVIPTLTPTASVDALLAAGLNTIAETNPEFTDYANYITSNYMMDVDRLQYRDDLINNTSETILAALSKGDVIADAGDMEYLNQPIEVPARDGSGMATIYPAASNFELDPRGALISGTNVVISGDAINNSGAILASASASLTANTITGTGGSIVVDAGEVALTALGQISFEDYKIEGASVDIIAGQDFVGKGVSISAATDLSIFAITGVTLTALEKEYEINRNTFTTNPLTGEVVKTTFGTVTVRDQLTSSLTVGGNLSIITSGDLELAGVAGEIGGNTMLSAAGDLLLAAVQSEYEYHQGNAKNGTDMHNITSHVTTLNTGGDFVATAGGSAILVGTQIDAGGTVQLSAVEDVVLAAAQDIETFETRKSKSRFFGLSKSSSSHSITNVTNQGVRIAASGDVDVIVETGDLTTAGTSFVSNHGDINLSAIEGDIYAGIYTDIFREETKKSKSFLFGLLSSSSTLNTVDKFNTGTEALAALDLSLVSGADTTLVGATLSTGQNLNINTGGDFSVLAAIDSQRSEFFSSNMGLITMTTIQERSFVETAVFTQLLAGQALNLGIGGETELVVFTQSGVDAPSLEVLYPEELLALAGLNLLTQELANEYFYDKQTSLSPAFKMLVTIVISLYVPGLGGALGLEGAAGTAATAFGNNFIVGSVEGVVSGDFDLGSIIGDAFKAGLTAGLTAGISNSLFGGMEQFDASGKLIKDKFGNSVLTKGPLTDFISELPDESLLGFGSGNLSVQNLMSGGIDNVISAGVNSAIYGTDFDDALTASLVRTVVNLTLADVQNVIGGIGDGIENWEGSPAHMLLHGLAGCAAAEATGVSCAAGAAGAVVQSVYAGSQTEPDPSEFGSAEEFEQAYIGWKYQTTIAAEMYGAGIGFLLSGGDAANVTAAASIAKSAYENNYLKHDEWNQYLEAIEQCGEIDVCLQLVHKAALETSLANRHKLLMCGPDMECKRALEADVEYLSDPVADAAVQALQNLDYYEVRSVGGGNIATSSVVDLVTGNTEDYISYPDFYASSCGSLSVQQCVGNFAREKVRLQEDSANENLLVIAGLSAALLAPLVAGPAVGFASSSFKAITACAANPVCWTEMTMLGGEVVLGATNAVQGQAFVTIAATGTALAGRVILQKGDEIIAVLDDLGRLFRPVSQTVDDAGRFLVKSSDNVVGYLDDAQRFVPSSVPNTATIGGKTCVYSCVVNGTTRYVGITDDVARRGAEHLSQKGIEIEGIRGLSNISRADAHAVEQTLINYYGLGKNGGTLLNKINSISPTRNPTAYEQSLIRGKELLDSVDYQWMN